MERFIQGSAVVSGGSFLSSEEQAVAGAEAGEDAAADFLRKSFDGFDELDELLPPHVAFDLVTALVGCRGS